MATLKIIVLAVTALAFVACSNDEGASDEWNGEIRLSCGLDVQSRAATGLLNKYFDSGTEIGVQISEKTTGTAYTPLVYKTTDDSGSLELLADYEQPYYPSSGDGVNIYAVYPQGTGTSFTVEQDQSEAASYKASDLMYASTSTERTSKAVALEFNHLLSKVTITLESGAGTPNLDGAKVELIGVKPTTAFTASSGDIGTSSGEAKDITVFTATSTSLSGSCIVPPQTLATEFVRVTLKDKGVLIGKLNEGTPTLETGKEYKYTIKVNLTELSITASIEPWNGEGNSADGEAKMYIGDKFSSQAAIGDYYMSDGSLVDKDATLTDVQKTACIGIVFALASDAGDYDESDYTATDIGQQTCHGYVVALNDANSGNTCAWVSSYDYDNLGDSNGSSTSNWSGYDNTQTLLQAYSSATNIAAYYAKEYTPVAPSCTSGWFLPSAAQLRAVVEAVSGDSSVGSNLTTAGGITPSNWYWSSSWGLNNSVGYALVIRIGYNTYYGVTDFSYYRFKVLPILAF